MLGTSLSLSCIIYAILCWVHRYHYHALYMLYYAGYIVIIIIHYKCYIMLGTQLSLSCIIYANLCWVHRYHDQRGSDVHFATVTWVSLKFSIILVSLRKPKQSSYNMHSHIRYNIILYIYVRVYLVFLIDIYNSLYLRIWFSSLILILFIFFFI